jgi:hypothetical protein
MLRELKCVQPKAVLIPLVITWTTGTPAVSFGSQHATVADTGAGVVTVTMEQAGAQDLFVVATSVVAATGTVSIPVVHTVDEDSFVIETSDEGGALADPLSVNLMVIRFDSADEV